MKPALAAAYAAAHYELQLAGGAQVCRIGQRRAAIERALRRAGCRRQWVLITASNPRSRRLCESLNRQRQRALAQVLHRHGWRCVPAQSSADDGDWREHGFAVFDVPLHAVKPLARRYGQLALVGARLGRAPQLHWL
ncbi:Protein of unknown function [Solimonas aquatica]|uniref:DUF3293 domain-containing protein n=1 Tax=Solimonas aquatica TaxID=489703 RepID=A0A1H9DFH7_9GAMM|nr:DUF3293 domain-containing protein [Solimonas aquatica]SEQ12240.1 Protein of unknown function [Solimonas aquatica]